MSDITKTDRELIEEIRQKVKHVMPKAYDTDYNILRWIKGWNYNKDEALYWIQRHFKTRKALELDDLDKLEDDVLTKEYYPQGLVGPTGKNNTLLMIECSGRVDIDGLTKSLQATSFFRRRMKFFERVYKEMNALEAKNKRQSGVVYVMDLEGIVMDPFLLPALNGSYRMMCSTLGCNYPEWVDVIIIVNVPTFFSVLWKAFSPFLPDATKSKIKLLSGDWKTEILDYVKPECLPVHWGGTLVDEFGDPMCRSKIVVPKGKIPSSLYWKPDGTEPPEDKLITKTIGAGAFVLVSFYTPNPGVTLRYFLSSSDEYTFAVYYTEDTKETDIKKMDEMFPQVEVPGGMAPETWHVHFDKAGAYHVKFGNEKAWFLSISPKYYFEFVDRHGNPASVIPLNN